MSIKYYHKQFQSDYLNKKAKVNQFKIEIIKTARNLIGVEPTTRTEA
jgi:hypothetical protein